MAVPYFLPVETVAGIVWVNPAFIVSMREAPSDLLRCPPRVAVLVLAGGAEVVTAWTFATLWRELEEIRDLVDEGTKGAV